MTQKSHKTPNRHRRGSIYLLVLGASMLIVVIGMSTLLVARVEYRTATGAEDMAQARVYAASAMELALLFINEDPSWRTTRGNSNWPTDQPIGDGTYTIEVLDEIDGDVMTGTGDPVVVTAIGMRGTARQKIRAKFVPHDPAMPLELFNYGMYSDTGLVVLAGAWAKADRGAPIGTNTSVLNNGTIRGDVEAGSSIVNNGSITGVATAPVPLKSMPQPWVFDMYKEIATPIPFPGIIDREVVAPTRNPWGPPNTNGVYFIDVGNETLTIRDSRIHGTLVVQCGVSGRVVLEGEVHLHSYHPEFPTLIVDGDVTMSFTSDIVLLNELALGTNFNPPDAPFHGSSDSVLDDTYSNEINGLVHITRQLLMYGTAEVDGVVICESTVTVDGDNEFNWIDNFRNVPPLGYTEIVAGTPMVIVPGSWRPVVD